MLNSYENDLEMTWDVDGLFLTDPLSWLNIFNDCSNDNAVTSNTRDLPSDGPSTTTVTLQHLIKANRLIRLNSF